MAGATMKLKLVRGETYACPKIKGGEPIKKGETVEVDTAIGAMLLEDTYRDASNNDHYYFKDVTDEVEADDEDSADESKAKAPAKAPATRTRSAK